MDKLYMLGDSVFDNVDYVKEGERGTEAWTKHLLEPYNVGIEFLALDGATTVHVRNSQLGYLDQDTELIVMSIGGNDLLGILPLLETNQGSMLKTFAVMEEERESFRKSYAGMLEAIRKKSPKAKIGVFDIYYPCWKSPRPFRPLPPYSENLDKASRMGVDLFNKTIRDFFEKEDVKPLSSICSEEIHFADPIEPSSEGSRVIAEAVRDFYLQFKH